MKQMVKQTHINKDKTNRVMDSPQGPCDCRKVELHVSLTSQGGEAGEWGSQHQRPAALGWDEATLLRQSGRSMSFLGITSITNTCGGGKDEWEGYGRAGRVLSE